MADRHFPVRPNLEQLKHQAKDLLRAVRAGDANIVAEFQRNHPESVVPERPKLADAQLALARAYGLASWPRLVTACRLIDAIWRDDVQASMRAQLCSPPAINSKTTLPVPNSTVGRLSPISLTASPRLLPDEPNPNTLPLPQHFTRRLSSRAHI